MLKKRFLYGSTAFLLLILGVIVITSKPSTGIGVSRQEMVDALGTDFKFEAREPIDGKDNIVGIAPSEFGSAIQFVGPEDNPTHVSMVAFAVGGSRTKAAKQDLRNFVGAVDEDATVWINDILLDADFEADWTESNVINERRIDFSYTALFGEGGAFDVAITRE